MEEEGREGFMEGEGREGRSKQPLNRSHRVGTNGERLNPSSPHSPYTFSLSPAHPLFPTHSHPSILPPPPSTHLLRVVLLNCISALLLRLFPLLLQLMKI